MFIIWKSVTFRDGSPHISLQQGDNVAINFFCAERWKERKLKFSHMTLVAIYNGSLRQINRSLMKKKKMRNLANFSTNVLSWSYMYVTQRTWLQNQHHCLHRKWIPEDESVWTVLLPLTVVRFHRCQWKGIIEIFFEKRHPKCFCPPA